jgi:hypothetical protein
VKRDEGKQIYLWGEEATMGWTRGRDTTEDGVGVEGETMYDGMRPKTEGASGRCRNMGQRKG